MTTTWTTDAEVIARCALAPTALTAYSEALVAAGQSAVTTYDRFRVLAQNEILRSLRARGIQSGDITRTDEMAPVEQAGALYYLFEAVAQFTPEQGGRELYSQQAIYWRSVFDRDLSTASPIDGIKSVGRSFTWGRG